MGKDKPAYKRDLSVTVATPSDKHAQASEDFPSPPPLYTPTAQELDQVLEKEMADAEKKPTLVKTLSLSIDKPTDKAIAEDEPPVDVLPTPSAKEVESALEADMKGWKDGEPPKTEENGTSGLSKSQKKKAKKKAQKSKGPNDSAESTDAPAAPQPVAYVPGSQWEPEDDDDEEEAPKKADEASTPAPSPPTPVQSAPSPAESTPAPLVPDAADEPVQTEKKKDGSDAVKNDAPKAHEELAKPETDASAPAQEAATSVPIAKESPATNLKAEVKANAEEKSAKEEVDNAASTPSRLASEKLSVFSSAQEESTPPVLERRTSDSGSAGKKWATVPAPVARKSLALGDKKEADSKLTRKSEDSNPEPQGPIPYEHLLAGNPEKWPKGIKPHSREKYLSDDEFKKVFDMSKGEFSKLKEWKRNDLKKHVKLF